MALNYETLLCEVKDQVATVTLNRPQVLHALNAKVFNELEAVFVARDVTRRETIEAARAGIEKEFGRLDILVNNAGIYDRADGSPVVADIDAVSRTLQTNFVGALAVTQGMLPLIRKSAAGRIVNVSSELGSITGFGDPNWPFAKYKTIGYCASKAAMTWRTSVRVPSRLPSC